MSHMSSLRLFLILLFLISIISSQGVSASTPQTFQAYQITVKGFKPASIGILPHFIFTVKPYWKVNDSSPGEYRLLYFAYPSYYNITNWTFEYVNLTNFPGITYRLGNVTLPWPTNNFTIFSYDDTPVLHWQAKNGTTYDYFLGIGPSAGDKEVALPVVVTHYTKNSQMVGHLEGNYVVFNGSNTTLKIPEGDLSKYYPEQFLNDLRGVIYRDVVYIWNSTTASYVAIHRKAFLIYPLRLSYWKANGKVYIGTNLSKGVELKANQSIPILLYAEGKLKPLVDVLRLITPQGDPLRNLKNPVITLQRLITPATQRDILNYFEDTIYSRYYKLHYSLVSNGSSAVLTVTVDDWIPFYYPYLVVDGTPAFFNLSPTWTSTEEQWTFGGYEFKFGVWGNHYELLWEKSPPVLNSSIAYRLNGTCWMLIGNFHNFPGFVANGTVEGNYMVFHFNDTTLRIPLKELAKYYPPRVWGWKLAAAKNGNGYLITPDAWFHYSVTRLVWVPGGFLLPVDNSSGVYALYYVNGTLRPVFDLLRLMSLKGDLVRNLPNPFNSSVTFGLCGLEWQSNTSVRVTQTTATPKEKSICGPGLIAIVALGAVLPVRRVQRRESTKG